MEYRGDFAALLVGTKSRGEGMEPVLKTQHEVVRTVEAALGALGTYEGLLLVETGTVKSQTRKPEYSRSQFSVPWVETGTVKSLRRKLEYSRSQFSVPCAV